MKHFIKKILREGLFDANKPAKIFIRKTYSPKNDLIRNFSCYADAWFDTEEEAEEYEGSGIGQGVRQDPVTKKWCGDSESGLSGYLVENEEQYNDGIQYIMQIPHLKSINEISVFKSKEYYLEDGSDGEDTFINGEYLFNFLPTTSYEVFAAKIKKHL